MNLHCNFASKGELQSFHYQIFVRHKLLLYKTMNNLYEIIFLVLKLHNVLCTHITINKSIHNFIFK